MDLLDQRDRLDPEHLVRLWLPEALVDPEALVHLEALAIQRGLGRLLLLAVLEGLVRLLLRAVPQALGALPVPPDPWSIPPVRRPRQEQ